MGGGDIFTSWVEHSKGFVGAAVERHARYAEAFHVSKLVLGAAPLIGIDPG